ncbi:UNVERIFIED_CONTAM: hypothetical protein Sangu_3188900 [Sesamum angustifolium]|uniref:Reverse transcriptase domain-containing protein n=1 Tax=Sesamum angustifolium TaxID=2727405 RepID=A0AAW2JQ25_9LAMI
MPLYVSDYRPISCCNVLYKAITKIMVKRIHRILPLMIDNSQNAFVPGRSITDNILLAQELLAGYNQMRLPNRCTLKVDIQKAYDSVKWDFLLEVLRTENKSSKEPDYFIPISAAGTATDTGLPGISRRHIAYQILGIPLTSSRLTMSDCRPLIDKVEARLAGWNHQNLSYAGRLQLIKSVLGTLHMYWASAFILPKGVLKILEKKMRRFLWHGSGNAKVAWAQICKPKQEGGLGIRSLVITNQALMLKQLWRLLQNDGTSIWVEWIQRHRLRHLLFGLSMVQRDRGAGKAAQIETSSSKRCHLQSRDGSSFSLWQDVWHEGPLCLTFPRGPVITGLPLSSPLPAYYSGTSGAGRPQRDADIAEIISQLPPTQPSAADRFVGEAARVPMAVLEWQRGLNWASKKWRGNHLVNAAFRATLAALVYHLWVERNNRKFAATSSSAESTTSKVLEDVRMRIMVAECSTSLQSQNLYRIWIWHDREGFRFFC